MKHTALTIGPILKTLKSAKSTKAIWAASYMFSYLMKNIINELNLSNTDVLLPYFEDNDLTDKLEVGLFPDRLIIKKHVKDIDNIIETVIGNFAEKVFKDIGGDKTTIKKFFNEYLTIHSINVDIEDAENAIFKINSYLDTAELKQKIIGVYETDYLVGFLENTFYNFLIKNEFDSKEQRFPSTIEIAMAEFKDDSNYYKNSVQKLFKKQKGEDKVDNQQLFITEIYENETFKNRKRNYQKYIAIVQADGDNIGDFIKQLYLESNKDELIARFSKHLLQFGKESVQLIKDYQGTPIYAGGDDLLYFCPIAHNVNKDKQISISKSYLTLIKQIDCVFNKLFKEDSDFKPIIERIDKKPSMSYGVSISYYKFPLNEALEQGASQLFGKAKRTTDKNAVAYSVLKHSGQHFGTIFHKHQNSFETFEELLKQHVSDENYLHGVVYKLEPQQKVFYAIGQEDEEKRNKQFDNFFENNFDESEHTIIVNGKKELKPFLKMLKKLFKDVYTENLVFKGANTKIKEQINKSNLNKLYASLRFIGFIHNKEER